MPAAGAIRWIPPLRLDGCHQMAIDEWLLDAAWATPHRSASAALRFYRWRRPTLSLGFHQRRLAPHWGSLAAAGAIELVRRPSGGRAVLHAGDLTYALVWPDAPRGRLEAYRRACRWLQEAFRVLGQPLEFGHQAATGANGNCFASSTAADLVHGSGVKRIGSAQLWRRGCLLQHGSIQIDPPVALWREVFGEDPPPLPRLPLQGDALIAHLREAAAQHLPMAAAGNIQAPAEAALPRGQLEERPLARPERAAITQRLERYRLAPSTATATSPELTIPRAT